VIRQLAGNKGMLKDIPIPYFSSAIMAHARRVELFRTRWLRLAGGETSPQALQRNRSISNTVAFSGACPMMRIGALNCHVAQ
jgi:hypothetical protein